MFATSSTIFEVSLNVRNGSRSFHFCYNRPFYKGDIFGRVLVNRLSRDPTAVFCRELPNLIYFRLKSKKPVILHGTFLSVRVLHRCSVFTLKTEPKTC